MMRTAKNKRLEITLTSDEMTLLESVSVRFNISKSSVIKQALKVFAAKRKHYLTLSYKEVNVSEEPTKGAIIREKEDHKVKTKIFEEIEEEPIKKEKTLDDYTDEELANMSPEEYNKLLPF